MNAVNLSQCYALIIALEEYLEPGIAGQRFAVNDAQGVSAAFKRQGVPAANITVMTNGKATKTSVESKLRLLCKNMDVNSTLFVYYVGHGFESGGENYLSCYDYVLADPSETSIKLDGVLQQLKATQSKRLFLFFDANILHHELAVFCQESQAHLAFVASQENEPSYGASALKHGIWAYHLIQSLSGKEPLALEGQAQLSAKSLQKYMAEAVPKSVRAMYTGTCIQNPRSFGMASGDCVLFDGSSWSAHPDSKAETKTTILRQAYFESRARGNIKSLTAWKTSYNMPKDAGSSTREFIKRVGDGNVKATIDKYYQEIKQAFAYKRTDCRVISDGNSQASCITPQFTFSVELSLDLESASHYVERISVSEIQDESVLFTPAFASVFDRVFGDVVLELEKPIQMEPIIDAIEGLDDSSIQVTYPSDNSSCSVKIAHRPMTIEISPTEIRFCFANKESIRVLADSVTKCLSMLGTNVHLPR